MYSALVCLLIVTVAVCSPVKVGDSSVVTPYVVNGITVSYEVSLHVTFIADPPVEDTTTVRLVISTDYGNHVFYDNILALDDAYNPTFNVATKGIFRTVVIIYVHGKEAGRDDLYIVHDSTQLYTKSVGALMYKENFERMPNIEPWQPPSAEQEASNEPLANKLDDCTQVTISASLYYLDVARVPTPFSYVSGSFYSGNILYSVNNMNRSGSATFDMCIELGSKVFLQVRSLALYFEMTICDTPDCSNTNLFQYECPTITVTATHLVYTCTIDKTGIAEFSPLFIHYGKFLEWAIASEDGPLIPLPTPNFAVTVQYGAGSNAVDPGLDLIFIQSSMWDAKYLPLYHMSMWLFNGVWVNGAVQYMAKPNTICNDGSIVPAIAFIEGYAIALTSSYFGSGYEFIYEENGLAFSVEFYYCPLYAFANVDGGRVAALIWDVLDSENDCNGGDVGLGTSYTCDNNAGKVISPQVAFKSVAQYATHSVNYAEILLNVIANTRHDGYLAPNANVTRYNWDVFGLITVKDTFFQCPYGSEIGGFTVVGYNNTYPCDIDQGNGYASTRKIDGDYIMSVLYTNSSGSFSYIAVTEYKTPFDKTVYLSYNDTDSMIMRYGHPVELWYLRLS